MSVFFTAQPLVLTFRGHSFDPSQYLLPFLTLYLEVMLILLLYQIFFANVLACGESAAARPDAARGVRFLRLLGL